MPDKPVIFLSSTMRSLKQLRNAISEKIKALGYEALVAEYDFTAAPGRSIQEACLGNIERCDILILILDATYGTPVNGDWLVRREFLHAKRQGKAIYIVVDQEAWHSYHLAIAHPNINPADYHIHPEVVRFLKEIADSGEHWIFPFSTVGELGEKLKEQFSAHYAVLLRDRSQALLIRTEHLLAQMHSLYRQKIYVQALLFSEEVLHIDRDNPEALITRAVCRIRLHGMNETEWINKGIEDCRRIIADDPRSFRARYNLANFKLLSPDYDTSEVEEDLRMLFAEFPEYEFYFNEDTEFKPMLELRKSWSRFKKKRVSGAKA